MMVHLDTGWARYTSTMLLKVKPGTDATFESKLFKSLSNTLGTSMFFLGGGIRRICRNFFSKWWLRGGRTDFAIEFDS